MRAGRHTHLRFLWKRDRAWSSMVAVKLRLAVALATLAAAIAWSADAAPSCKSLAVTALAFGNYDVYNGSPTDSAGTISYSCPPPTVPTVMIDAGLAPSPGQRGVTPPHGRG